MTGLVLVGLLIAAVACYLTLKSESKKLDLLEEMNQKMDVLLER